MPATGLQDVKQKIDLDAAGYVRGSDEIVLQAIRMAKENNAVIKVWDDMKVSVKGLQTDISELRTNLGYLTEASRQVRDVQEEMNKGFEKTSGLMRAHAEQTNMLLDKYSNLGEAARKVTAEQHAIADSFLTSMEHGEGYGSVLDALESRLGVYGKSARERNAAMEEEITQLVTLRTEIVKTGEAVAKTSIFATPFQSTGGDQASFTGDNSIAAYAASLAAARRTAVDAEMGIMAAQMGGGGGAGGGGRGGGGGGGGAPSFVPWGGGGWQAVRFWGMMTAEVAATVVPALTAAGAAALVGVQSVEAMVPRYKAIFSTSEALGDALGMTTGKFLGGGTALQDAQNAFQGGGYDVAGNLLSIIQGGGGQGFIKMGESTLGMIARGTSQMALNFTQGGTGKKLSDALGGGPGYLRQFGDVFSNLGNTLLNVAPNLPGVGEDLLGTLSGGTGFLASATRDIPGPLMKGFLTYEAASRWLPALLGGQGLIGRMLGLRGVGGIGGLISRGGESLFARGMGGALGDAGLGMMGFGDALAGIGGFPAALALAGGTMEIGALNRASVTPWGTKIAGLQQGIANAGFTGAWQPLGHAVTTVAGLQATAPAYAAPTRQQLISKEGAGLQAAYALSQGPQAEQALGGFARQMGELTNAGPALQAALKKAGLKGVGLADAFQIGQNALLDLPHAFGKDGKLTQVAQQMVTAYAKVIGPMTQSPGAFGAAMGAQTIMSQGAMENLSKVNSAMDSMTQIMTAGPVGMANLFGLLGGAPVSASHAPRQAGIQLKAPPAFKKMAQALTSFTTAGGAAAWQTFAGPQGLITAEQGNLDQLRTAMTLGAMGIGGAHSGAQGLAGFQVEQMLPLAKKSPAALAMLMQQEAQMGIGGYYQGDPNKPGVQAANYAAAVKATAQIADNNKQANQATTAMAVNLSKIPTIAKQFADATATTVASQRVARVAQDAIDVKGGMKVQIHAADIVSQLRAAGVQGASALRASLDAVLSQAGVGKAQRIKIEAQVIGQGPAEKLKALIDSLHGKNVTVNASANASAVNVLKNAIDGVHGKSVTITVTTINRMITQAVGAGIIHTAGGVLGATMVGGPAGMRLTSHASGGLIPGSGGGDIYPAMLTPGEAVVPRNLVPLIAPFLAAHGVPGFGGMPQSNSSHFADGGLVGLPGVFRDMFIPPSVKGKSGNLAWTLIDEITKALTQAGAKKIATALISKIGQEIAFAKNTASSVTSGLNLGGMDLTQGSVLGQMQNYAVSAQSFAGELKTLRKQGLAKGLISQLIAAGPVQGDLLAQSILGTGTKGVNQVWKQIQGSGNAIGAQAAMSQFGGFLAPNLKSGSFSSNNVTINVNASGSGGLNLSDADIKKLVAQIQAALLKQAKRNNKTGVQLSGKGA